MGLEAASLVRDPVWRGVGVEHGKDRPVLLIPGFLAGDGSLALMTRWLRANGYRTHRAGMRAHVDCSKAVCDRLEGVLEEM
ncbi:MAG: alpha/beta hydrolase, partial [Actinomycetes bacterium]